MPVLDLVRATANALPPDHRITITVQWHPEVPMVLNGDMNPAYVPAQEILATAADLQGVPVDVPPPPPPPPNEEQMIVNTEVGKTLNMRSGPSATSSIILSLKRGQLLAVRGSVKAGIYTWTEMLRVDELKQSGYVAREFLKPAPLPPAPTPPADQPPSVPILTHAIGIHAHYNVDTTMILAMVDRLLAAGKRFACVTVISNVDLANALAQRGITVVFRQTWDDRERYDASMLDSLTPEQAEAKGRAFYRGEHYPIHQRLDRRIFLKFVNERGFHAVVGNEFWIGLMKAADAEGRKLAIFGDSVGAPEVADWVKRVPALRYAAAHGHYVTLNEYGRFDVVNGQKIEGDHPVSDEQDYLYYGGRHELFYDAAPDDCRPLLIIGETGPSHSSVTHSREFIAGDVRKYSAKLKASKYAALIIGFCYFTLGKWKECSLDAYADEFEQAVMQS